MHITADVVEEFARMSGDRNPLHTDEAYGKTTPFRGRVPHGMIAGMFFSRLIGMYLPGKYALYLSQTLKFHKPFPMEDSIIVRGTITDKSDAHKAVSMTTVAVHLPTGALLVDGQAIVKLLQ